MYCHGSRREEDAAGIEAYILYFLLVDSAICSFRVSDNIVVVTCAKRFNDRVTKYNNVTL